MKKSITIVALLALFFACAGGGEAEGGSKATASAAEAIDAKALYKTYCMTCHGLYGDMGASGAFNLQTSELALEERIAVITKGRNVMTAFEGTLSPEKIKAVAEYTMTLKK